MGGYVSKVTDAVGLTNYGDQKKAADKATNAQLAASNQQLEYQKEADRIQAERLQPFVDIGKNNISPYQNLLTRSGQMDYLTGNPMFDAAVNKQNEELKYASAAGGRANSGDIRNALFQNYLASGENTIDRQINRLLGAIGIGQASATGQAANSLNIANNVTDIFGNQGDIRSSGIMARQNINNSAVTGGTNLLMQGATMWAGAGFPGMSGLTSMFGGGAAAAGGGGSLAGIGSGSIMSGFSDRRLKTDIEEIGRDELGGVYSFRYIDSAKRYIGRMADELLQTRPDAVFEDDSGYLRVTAEFKPRAA